MDKKVEAKEIDVSTIKPEFGIGTFKILTF
jgi:hypothetical protein